MKNLIFFSPAEWLYVSLIVLTVNNDYSPKHISLLICVMEVKCVCFEVGTGFLDAI